MPRQRQPKELSARDLRDAKSHIRREGGELRFVHATEQELESLADIFTEELTPDQLKSWGEHVQRTCLLYKVPCPP